MAKKSTTEDFIRKARLVHGDKYDYSKVKYVNDRTEVCIICPIHGDFWQTPRKHLSKHGCHICAIESRKRLKYGVATNDMLNQEHTKCYSIWNGIIRRCYGENRSVNAKCYENCTVCEEWLTFSNFKSWYDDHYVDGYHIDKDIFGVDSKIYSPNTCVFIPSRLNTMFQDKKGKGVMKNAHSYAVSTTINGEHYYEGGYNTEDEAHQAYIELRRNLIYMTANEMYENSKIDKRTYLAILNKIGKPRRNVL